MRSDPTVTCFALAVCTALAACAPAETAQSQGRSAAAAESGAELVALSDATITVYKSPTCGCCGKWVAHLRAAGFNVQVEDREDMMAVKEEQGLPPGLTSCHTAVVDGYVVEGHVPADVVARMLSERPDVAGITVPGMPIGSPGMEGENPVPYDVLAFSSDGRTEVYESR